MRDELAALWEADRRIELDELRALRAGGQFERFFSLGYGEISDDGAAIAGRDGFLFVHDGSNRWKDQLAGTVSIDEAALAGAVGALERMRKEAVKRGIAFHCLFVPEKDVVHHALSPNTPAGVVGQRSVHRIMSGLSFGSVYPVIEMLDAVSAMDLFLTRNSHCNFFGALIVANALLAAMGREPLAAADVPVTQTVRRDDLSSKWALNLRTRRRAVARVFEEEVLVKTEGHVGQHVRLDNPALRGGGTLVLMGDSHAWTYDTALSRFLACRFSTVHFIWKKQVDWEVVDRIRPDAIVLESAERFLVKGLI